VPQHATDPAVALPISGDTSSCMPCGLRVSRIWINSTAAPTVTVMASRSILMLSKLVNRIWVPSDAKHPFNE
jgi:hypothetical protein